MTEDLKLTTEVKKQHTVPRFLLDNFGFEKGGARPKNYIPTISSLSVPISSLFTTHLHVILFTILKTILISIAWSLY